MWCSLHCVVVLKSHCMCVGMRVCMCMYVCVYMCVYVWETKKDVRDVCCFMENDAMRMRLYVCVCPHLKKKRRGICGAADESTKARTEKCTVY